MPNPYLPIRFCIAVKPTALTRGATAQVRNGVLEVVDGKQRLTSVWSFIQEEFPDLEPFRLSGASRAPCPAPYMHQACLV